MFTCQRRRWRKLAQQHKRRLGHLHLAHTKGNKGTFDILFLGKRSPSRIPKGNTKFIDLNIIAVRATTAVVKLVAAVYGGIFHRPLNINWLFIESVSSGKGLGSWVVRLCPVDDVHLRVCHSSFARPLSTRRRIIALDIARDHTLARMYYMGHTRAIPSWNLCRDREEFLFFLGGNLSKFINTAWWKILSSC